MKRTKGFIEIGLLAFWCAALFLGTAAVKSGSTTKTAEAAPVVQVAEAQK